VIYDDSIRRLEICSIKEKYLMKNNEAETIEIERLGVRD
jgi:hypothetical protein